MSYFIDTKYLSIIGHRLPLFSKKSQDLWNCRCIICGDSQKKKNKARGYFYRNKNDLFYKCHNCQVSQHFGTFLQNLDAHTYQQYVMERYASGMNGPKAHKNPEQLYTHEEPVFKKDPLKDVAFRLDTLEEDHEAILYCTNRNIPKEKFSELFFIPSVKDIIKIAPKYWAIKTNEPRLLLPFYDEEENLVGVAMRGMRNEHLRYINIKIDEKATLIFGLNKVDKKKNIPIVEGPIDSLFLSNSLAVAGTGFNKLETLSLPKDKIVVVVDNQPRNTQVCDLVDKYINLNYNVCIWPCNILEKDINDMVSAGHDVENIIAENTYNGLMAQLKFTEWRNC